MSVDTTVDFSNDNYLYYGIDYGYGRYTTTLNFDGNNKDFDIVLSKNQFQEFLQKLLDEDFYEIDDDGKMKVGDL